MGENGSVSQQATPATNATSTNSSPGLTNHHQLPLHPSPNFLTNQSVNNQNTMQSTADYLAQLLKDKKQLAAFPNVFHHLERLLDDGKLSTWVSGP